MNLCAHSLVLLSHPGCIETVLRSVIAAKFIPLDTDAVIGHLDIVLSHFTRWKRHGTLDLSSENLKHAPLHSAALVHHALAIALDVPYKPRDFSVEAKAVTEESNKEIPHRTNSAEVNQRIHDMLQPDGPVQAHFRDDERLIGWTWTCENAM